MRNRHFARVWTSCFSEGVLQEVEVQVLLRSGLPRFDIIGLPQNMIREGKDRIYSALSCMGIDLPSQKILVNLQPGDLKKEGSHFDLPILVGILKCLGLVPTELDSKEFYWGELQLDGKIQKLPHLSNHFLFAEAKNASSMLANGPADQMNSLKRYLQGQLYSCAHIDQLLETYSTPKASVPDQVEINKEIEKLWLSDSRREAELWKNLSSSKRQRLFWILVSLGRHHVLLEGSPGTGKTSWCRASQCLQLPLYPKQWQEAFSYQQAQNESVFHLIRRNFVEAHHSSSASSIVGGGNARVSAGAISQAHLGALFLDEFPEFSRDVLENLREPLESKYIQIARTGVSQKLPADIQLFAAMNPCACGNYESKKLCQCSPAKLMQYRSKISEPLRDRFHWRVWWSFEEDDSSEWRNIQDIKHRLLEAKKAPSPKIKLQSSIPKMSPRRQQKFLEIADSWCRWFGLTEFNDAEALQLMHFQKEMETKNETHQSRRA